VAGRPRPIPTFPMGRPSIHTANLFNNNQSSQHGFKIESFYTTIRNVELFGFVLLRSPSTGGI
jgi:hypothetical protein